MGLDINLEKLESLAIDVSTFPHATLEIKNQNETFIKRVKFKTHTEAEQMLIAINKEWYKVILERNK